MINKLESIILQKQYEVTALYQRLKQDVNHPIAKVLYDGYITEHVSNFKHALTSSSLTIIAEIKRKSPSKGVLAHILDPINLAERYIAGGANALSILTDKEFFAGNLDDLIQVAPVAHQQSIPILRKDFIIDKIQIAEAAVAGASAVLCIVSILGKTTKAMLEFAHSLQLDVLVEVHDHDELQVALDCGAEIIGINNRNLKTFAVDTQQALRIITTIPDSIIKVAESGINHPDLARKYYEAGFDAVLIGESLVTSADPKHFIQACRYG